jgi:hypothetical protein
LGLGLGLYHWNISCTGVCLYLYWNIVVLGVFVSHWHISCTGVVPLTGIKLYCVLISLLEQKLYWSVLVSHWNINCSGVCLYLEHKLYWSVFCISLELSCTGVCLYPGTEIVLECAYLSLEQKLYWSVLISHWNRNCTRCAYLSHGTEIIMGIQYTCYTGR